MISWSQPDLNKHANSNLIKVEEPTADHSGSKTIPLASQVSMPEIENT